MAHAQSKTTSNHDEIRQWAQRQGARPSQVRGTGGLLRFDLGEPDERLEEIDWDRFFEVFDGSNLALIYEPDGRFNKFVSAGD